MKAIPIIILHYSTITGRADLDPVEEIDHFVIHHADATGATGGLGCTVNAVFGVADIEAGPPPRGFPDHRA